MDQLANCSHCGQLSRVNHRELCPQCNHNLDLNMNLIMTYLRGNRKATPEDINAHTQIPLELIKKYIMEGRILTHDYPNLNYACYFCEERITKGYLCKQCASKLLLEFKDMLEKEGYASIEDYVRKDIVKNRVPRELEKYVVESKNVRKQNDA